MGLTSSGDTFCHRTDEALAGIPGVRKLVDNGHMMEITMKQLMGRVSSVCSMLAMSILTLSAKKSQIDQTGYPNR